MISENLPRRTGLSANAGPGTGFEWTPGGREAGEIRMFDHWATGLRSGLLPQDCGVATPEVVQKRCHFERSFREGFDCWCQGKVFWRVLVGSWRSPASFLQGLATPVVRWEVSYEGKSFQKKWKFGPGQNFGKCPKLVREAPRAIQKIKKKLGPKGPWAQIWTQGQTFPWRPLAKGFACCTR